MIRRLKKVLQANWFIFYEKIQSALSNFLFSYDSSLMKFGEILLEICLLTEISLSWHHKKKKLNEHVACIVHNYAPYQ